jgi:LysR family glycine cleavage system transcriptional activator
MRYRLPPLRALLAFEAAARHLSIARAAEELCVTPAAISHHIRSLEIWFRIRLFDRSCFDQLASATDQVRVRMRTNQLSVVAPPSFALKWLLPRLHQFHKLRSDIELTLSVSVALTDCTHENTDFAIHYSTGGYVDLHVTRLAESKLFPVCRPITLLNGRNPPRSLDELAEHTLLHDDSLRLDERKDWRFWLQSVGSSHLEIADRGLHFSQASMAYEAAIYGHGVALGKSQLVHHDLKHGRLMRPFEHCCPTGLYYWAICRPRRAADKNIAALRDWLIGEMASCESWYQDPRSRTAPAVQSTTQPNF